MKTVLIALLVYAIADLSAQPGGKLDNYPGHIAGASFVYLHDYKGLALIGGRTSIPDSVSSDVWIWSGSAWSKVAASGPGSREFFPCVLDPSSGVVYGFAGKDVLDKPRGDMWRFANGQWTKVEANYPSTRDHHNMVYADHLKSLVIYGGQFPNRVLDTLTWLAENGKFTSLAIPGPGSRYHEGLVYDKHRKKVILYGGGEKPGEHWEFDGRVWVKVVTDVNPGNRLYHLMVYDEKNRRTVLHGGWRNQDSRDSVNRQTPTTWAYDGNKWKKVAEDPVFALAMGYDPVKGVVVAYGRKDLSQTPGMAVWELNPSGWTMKGSFGAWNTFEYVKATATAQPDNVQALLKYADLLQWQKKDYAEAEMAYKKLIVAFPRESKLLIELALMLSMQGKLDEASTYLARAEKLAPLDRYVYVRLGGMLRMDNRMRESIGYLEKALSMKQDGEDHFDLASSYAQVGEKDKAFHHLYEALALGFRNKATFNENAALVSLREDPRWKELIGLLE